MDYSLSQLPRYVSGGPMMVFAPDELEEPPEPGEVDVSMPMPTEPEPPAPSKEVVADAIRSVTDPAVAKRTIDAKIVEVAAVNRARAEKTLRSLQIPFQARSAAMGGVIDWLTGSGKLSDLSKYTPQERERLKEYLRAENLDVLEKTFTQDELDAVLAKINVGAGQTTGSAPLKDPYAAASTAYRAEVASALAPLGETATTVGASAAKTVGDGIVAMYEGGTSVPVRAFEWLGKLKWALGLAALGVGGYFAWPHIKPYVSENSTVGRKLNAARTLFGGGE